MQFSGQGKPPSGIIYNTTMSRPDAVLALALLHFYSGKKEARITAIAIAGSGLGAAMFCDALGYFYSGGRIPDSNNRLPVGLAANETLPPDGLMTQAVLDRRNEKGGPLYPRGIRKVSDTSEVLALVRNSLTGQADKSAVIIWSTPSTILASAIELPGVRDLVAAKVKTLIVCDCGTVRDVKAARTMLDTWPGAIVFCSRELGESIPFPASSIEKDFSWTPDHPVVDAYRAYQPMPYDAPSWDLAAMLYAIHSESGMFQLSDQGTLNVSDHGKLTFQESREGKHRSLVASPNQKEKIVQAYIGACSAKPVVRRPAPKSTA